MTQTLLDTARMDGMSESANRPPAVSRNESLRRGLAVMRELALTHEPTTTAEVARATRIPAPTVNRLLATLADERMAERTDDGKWRPGPGISELAGIEGRVMVMMSRAPEILKRLAEDTGETALLTRVRLPDSSQAILEESADRFLGATGWVGRVFDARRSVAGWITAAALDDGSVQSFAGDPGDAATMFLDGVAEARQRGYGFDAGGLETGLTSIAVSVPSSVPGMTVGIAGPSSRLNGPSIDTA
ncbi:MAG: helix-turn-helix domain-containing protein, partial [Acidimicrobiia bacterium]|nr:helix-turn-helix domain-containing protein [Acidimicrobiia bacterium]